MFSLIMFSGAKRSIAVENKLCLNLVTASAASSGPGICPPSSDGRWPVLSPPVASLPGAAEIQDSGFQGCLNALGLGCLHDPLPFLSLPTRPFPLLTRRFRGCLGARRLPTPDFSLGRCLLC